MRQFRAPFPSGPEDAEPEKPHSGERDVLSLANDEVNEDEDLDEGEGGEEFPGEEEAPAPKKPGPKLGTRYVKRKMSNGDTTGHAEGCGGVDSSTMLGQVNGFDTHRWKLLYVKENRSVRTIQEKTTGDLVYKL